MGWVEIKNAVSSVDTAFYVGDSYRIQTCNLLIRSQMLYSVELRSHVSNRYCCVCECKVTILFLIYKILFMIL